jgi:hypothetical protein
VGVPPVGHAPAGLGSVSRVTLLEGTTRTSDASYIGGEAAAGCCTISHRDAGPHASYGCRKDRWTALVVHPSTENEMRNPPSLCYESTILARSSA